MFPLFHKMSPPETNGFGLPYLGIGPSLNFMIHDLGLILIVHTCHVMFVYLEEMTT